MPSAVRGAQHGQRGVVDPRRLGLGPLEREPVALVGDLDHAAGVDEVVGAVDDAPLGERGCRCGRGPAGCWRRRTRSSPGASRPRRRRAPRRARTARRRRAPLRTSASTSSTTSTPGWCSRTHSMAAGSTSVTTTSAPSSRAWPSRCLPTLPTPAIPMRRPRQAGGVPAVAGRGEHPLVHAERRQHAGVAGPAAGDAAPRDEVALLGDDVHVLDVRADVARRDVPTAEALHEPPVRAQQLRRLVDRRVADDHGLAAAVVETGEGVLVGHRPGQVEHVLQRVVLGRVRVEAGAAERRPERGRVDRHDRPQPAWPRRGRT